MTQEDIPQVTSQMSAIPLSYATPETRVPPSNWPLVVIALFICGASVGTFAICIDGRQEPWAAALATAALAAMGSCFGFFLTRRR